MKESDITRKQKILDYMNSKEFKCMTVKQLAVIFLVPKDSFVYFEKLVNNLEKEGILYIDDSKRVCKLGFDKYICKYEAKSYGFGFGMILDKEAIYKYKKIDRIYITREDNFGAFDDDIVLVSIKETAKSGDSFEGKVIKIIARSEKKIVGTFEKSENFGFVKPMSSGIDDIYIPNKFCDDIITGDRVVVRVTKYPTLNRKAEGKIIEKIGNEDTEEIEHLTTFAEHNISEEFDFDVVAEAQSVAKIDKEDMIYRTDLRDKNIYTIDGDDAKDFDDAVSLSMTEDDKFKLSVHIADVSHYVVEGSLLDKEAIKRGTSIYTPGKVVPMLPVSLSNGICSLNENEDRLTLSIDMIIDKEGKVVDNSIYKSIISSKKRMTYSKVEAVLDKSDEEVLKEYEPYIADLELMNTLAKILKSKREKEGSINFDLPESKIVLDESGNVIDVFPYPIGQSNKLIEEFMLVSNMIVAEMFCNLDAPFIYRIHEAPDVERLKETNVVLSMLGANIKGINKVHPKAFSDALNLFKDDKNKSIIISNILLRSLKLAKYSAVCSGHFGLNFEYYTHFTSPIRRYPDLFIHRVISKYIANSYVLSEKEDIVLRAQAKTYAFSSSECEKISTEIERELDDIYKAKYMKMHLGETYIGVISGVTRFGIYVKLANTIQGLITLSSLEDDYYVYEEQFMQLIGSRTGKIYKIGDTLKVIVTRADVFARQIDFVIIGGSDESKEY